MRLFRLVEGFFLSATESIHISFFVLDFLTKEISLLLEQFNLLLSKQEIACLLNSIIESSQAILSH